MSILPASQSINNRTIQLIQNKLRQEAHNRARHVVPTSSNIGLDQTQHLPEFFERQLFRSLTVLLGMTHSGFPQCTRHLRSLYVVTTEFSSKVLMYQTTPTALIHHQRPLSIPESTRQTPVHFSHQVHAVPQASFRLQLSLSIHSPNVSVSAPCEEAKIFEVTIAQGSSC